jgi:hypothetical protein
MSNFRKNPRYNTGSNGSNNLSTLQQHNNLSGNHFIQNRNYNDAFKGGMNGTTYLNEPNYKNPQNILHNNINNNTLFEQTFNISLFIDSTFRNHNLQSNPFNFSVKLQDAPYETEKVILNLEHHDKNNVILNCQSQFIYYKNINGSDIVINIGSDNKNIRSVLLDAVILPRYINYITDTDGSIIPIGKQLYEMHKYLTVSIKELNNNLLHTNIENKDNNKDITYVIKYDDDTGFSNKFWYPINNTIQRYESNKTEIKKLTISINDNNGDCLRTTLDGQEVNFYQLYIDTINKIIKYNEKCDIKKINKLLPKLISLRDIINCNYPELHFTFNVLKPQINTKTNFNC